MTVFSLPPTSSIPLTSYHPSRLGGHDSRRQVCVYRQPCGLPCCLCCLLYSGFLRAKWVKSLFSREMYFRWQFFYRVKTGLFAQLDFALVCEDSVKDRRSTEATAGPSVVVHACNPNTHEDPEFEFSLWYSETMFQTNKTKQKMVMKGTKENKSQRFSQKHLCTPASPDSRGAWVEGNYHLLLRSFSHPNFGLWFAS